MGRDRRAEPRDRLLARAGAAPGLHRRPCDRRPRRDARRDGRPRRRSRAYQPAAAGRARDRPLRTGRSVRHQSRLHVQRRARVRTQPRALRVPALGPAGVRQLRGRAPGHGHLPPGEPRVPRARGVRRGGRCRRQRLSRHAGRHRLPHDDGERAGRARVGRGRDRGRGRDAGPARVDADPTGDRLQAEWRAARGRDRHRPRADRHPDAASEGRRGQVRGVLRCRARADCRSRTAPRSRTCPPSRGRPA